MNRIFVLIMSFIFCISSYSQELRFVNFTTGSTPVSISFRTDQDIIIIVSLEGKLLEWGNEMDRYRYNYYPGRLQPYMGRVDYYGAEADSASRGKLKMVGTSIISYYGAFETPAKAGKIKSIGRMTVDYYDNYENPSLKGKIKSAGYTLFSYYSSFENESFAGKLKSAGTTAITYYSSFEDKLIRGKIKSIGTFNYVWYSSNAGTGYQGALKSGSFTQTINSVTYIIM